MPAASTREFIRIWDWLENKNTLDIEALGNAINTWNTNELVRDALISRFHSICSSGHSSVPDCQSRGAEV